MTHITSNAPEGAPTWLDLGVPDMGFTVLSRPDGRYIGGILGEPGASTASWESCFAVADTDTAVRLISEGGGAVEQEPVDMPFGRFASVRDPFGARFQIIAPAEEPEG